MPNCSHSSLTVNRPLCANITNRIISSIGLTVFQDIMLGTVTHHPGSFVTYHSGSHRVLFPYLSRVRAGDRATEFKSRCRQLGINGVSLHSYRYAWAERAKTVGYLPGWGW